jgi:hypothetical protein
MRGAWCAAVLGAMVLAGCSPSRVVSAAETPVSSSAPAPSSPAPTLTLAPLTPVVRRAVLDLRGRTSVPLYAPASWPRWEHGPVVVSTTVAEGPPPGYTLTFLGGGRWIAQFAVRAFASPEMAALHPFGADTWGVPAIPPTFAGRGTAVPLGGGVAAHLVLMAAGPGRALVWRQDGWSLAVEFAPSAAARASAVARRLVAFCRLHPLPPSTVEGLAIVQLWGSHVVATLGWQRGAYALYTASAGRENIRPGAPYLIAFVLSEHIVPLGGP